MRTAVVLSVVSGNQSWPILWQVCTKCTPRTQNDGALGRFSLDPHNGVVLRIDPRPAP